MTKLFLLCFLWRKMLSLTNCTSGYEFALLNTVASFPHTGDCVNVFSQEIPKRCLGMWHSAWFTNSGQQLLCLFLVASLSWQRLILKNFPAFGDRSNWRLVLLCSLTKNGKLIVAPVPGAAMARASNNTNQENTVPSDPFTVKASTEVTQVRLNK